MVKIVLSNNEYTYLKNIVETEDIRFDSLKSRAKRNEAVKENSKIVDSLKEKLSDVNTSNSYSL